MSIMNANFVAGKAENNTIFAEDSRDNCNHPFWALREKFMNKGISLNTPDLNIGKHIAFELHLNAQKVISDAPAYLLMCEPNAIYMKNQSVILLNQYSRIFSWNDDIADGERYIKLNIPVFEQKNKFKTFGWNNRPNFSCLIASNKTVAKIDPRELYSKRIEAIRWFEKNAPEDFDLYGIGWNNIPKKLGMINKITSKTIEKTRIFQIAQNIAYFKPFPSYRGAIKSKQTILEKYKFSFCYENVSGLPGYITEKIFDCLFAGCIPIYWGAPNINKYIPSNCYIDRRDFKNYNSLYKYLKLMSELEFISYQQSIINYLNSDEVKKFYSEEFCNKVTNHILCDLVEIGKF